LQDADFLHQMLYLDTKIFMTSLNLTYNDKMSMASSVEVRVPFLDRELRRVRRLECSAAFEIERTFSVQRRNTSSAAMRIFCRAKCCGNRKPASPLQ
jgi:asparagine synthetase B (glutamine-hydrolysing)